MAWEIACVGLKIGYGSCQNSSHCTCYIYAFQCLCHMLNVSQKKRTINRYWILVNRFVFCSGMSFMSGMKLLLVYLRLKQVSRYIEDNGSQFFHCWGRELQVWIAGIWEYSLKCWTGTGAVSLDSWFFSIYI